MSGLGHNEHKTAVLSARDSDLSATIATCPWPRLKISREQVYLGIPFGRDLTLIEIYEPTLTKIEQRCTKYGPALKKMSLGRRILVFNIFIFSMLTYLNFYFPIPYAEKTGAEYRLHHLVSRHIIHYRTGYPRFHLIEPSSRVGPQPSLIDPLARSTAILAAQAPLSEYDGVSDQTPLMETQRRLGDSLIIEDCIAVAAAEFVHWHLEAVYTDRGEERIFRSATFIDPTDPNNARKIRGRIYNRLVYGIYHYSDQDPSLRRALKRRGCADDQAAADRLHAQFAHLRPGFPAHFRNFQFQLLFNALPTERRGRFYRPANAPAATSSCFLCKTGEDSITHLYGGDCPVATAARTAFGNLIQVDLSHTHLRARRYYDSSLLSFPPLPDIKLDRKAAQAMVTFNSTLWIQRTHFFKTRASLPALRTSLAASRIASAALSAWSHFLSPPTTATRYGSAGKRTPKQAAAARAMAAAARAKVPPGSLIAYTDGSAIGNPGPCGAGAVIFIYDPKGNLWHEETLSVGLGHGTNNLGELWAIGMVLSAVQLRIDQGYRYPKLGFIFTDSEYAKGCINSHWNTAINHDLVSALHHLLENSPIAWSLIWVPGHADVAGNEAADRAAEKGAKASKRGNFIDLATRLDCIRRKNFLTASLDCINFNDFPT